MIKQECHGCRETTSIVTLDELILTSRVWNACREIINEHNHRDALRNSSLEPRHKIFLIGPPGNGKTSLAHALAYEMSIPLLRVRYEGIITDNIGDTMRSIERLFLYAKSRPCVLLFDDADSILARRDRLSLMNMRPVLWSFLAQAEDLPSHVILIATADSHAQIDPSVWQKFQLVLMLPLPGTRQHDQFLRSMIADLGLRDLSNPEGLTYRIGGLSFAGLWEFRCSICRYRAIFGGGVSDNEIVEMAVVSTRLATRGRSGIAAHFDWDDKTERLDTDRKA